MNKFSYGNFDSTNEDIAFNSANGYSEPGNETTTRKQLSYPLKELKTYINNTVSVDGSENAVQLVVTNRRLKYRTTANGNLTDVPGCIPSGGTAEQVLAKSLSNVDASVYWKSIPSILKGTTEPTVADGNDGDIYILYEE